MTLDAIDPAQILVLLGFGAGSWSSYRWRQASRVKITELTVTPQDFPELHIRALRVALQESAEINTIAARWTALSIALSSLAYVGPATHWFSIWQ